MSAESDLQQLREQQGLLTDSLSRMVQGQWVGFPSLEADLEALSPGIHLNPRPPMLSSEALPPEAPDWLACYEPDTVMHPQVYDWTCSACALDWVLTATARRGTDREQTVYEIGYPENINSAYGLMNGSGVELQRVLADYGIGSGQGWLTFDQVYALAGVVPGMMSGGAWYHWVAIRGRDGENLWIANSAPGYQSVWSSLSRADFNRLGPFSVVWLRR